MNNAEIELTMRLLPADIRVLIAENGRLTRLIKPVSEIIKLGQPQIMTDSYWQLLIEQHNAMVEYQKMVDTQIDTALAEHNKRLKRKFPFF